MKKNDLKRHLKDYSIYGKRSSTISHAFASALSIADDYDVTKIDKAITIPSAIRSVLNNKRLLSLGYP